jgi:RimJ/RimL family protein N-acetyltransferase
MMTIRPLLPGEIERFAQVASQPEHAQDMQQYLERLLTSGHTHLEWCFVLEEADQIIGTIAYWTFPSTETPLDVVLFTLPWERDDYLTIGTPFLQHALKDMQGRGASKIGHVLDMPPVAPLWQYFAEQRMKLLQAVGFTMQRETLRFEWQAGNLIHMVPGRLIFRTLEEVGDAAFIEAIERGTVDTLDQRIHSEREQARPTQHARDMFALVQRLGYAPGWWQLAYNQQGELVGFVMPSANHTIGYIGVLPEYRGHGYIDELLAKATATLADAGAPKIQADTDVGNTPMANAFRRAGWNQFARRQEYTIDLPTLRL